MRGGVEIPSPPGNATSAARTALYLPGTAGNFVTTPAHASLDITGDLDLRILVALDDWTPAANQGLIRKRGASGQFGYYFHVLAGGSLRLRWSPDGTTELTADSIVPAATDGSPLWLRVTLDVDNGSGGYAVKFWTAPATIENPTAADFTQIGPMTTGGATTSIFANTAALEVGQLDPMAGWVQRAKVLDGLDGTVVADYRADAPMGPRYRDRTGKVWTLTGSAWSWIAPL